MGLDTSHNAWHGPYSSFHHWRINIAKHFGIDLEQMDGFKLDGRPWSEIPDRPINDLLNHSDCEGDIPWEKCEAIANDLDEVIAAFDSNGIENTYFISKTRQFAEGCRAAFNLKENIDFH